MVELPEDMRPSPFLDIPERWVGENRLAFAVDSLHPASQGHVLVLPKRIVLTPFDMTDAELLASFELLHQHKARIDQAYAPDGYLYPNDPVGNAFPLVVSADMELRCHKKCMYMHSCSL